MKPTKTRGTDARTVACSSHASPNKDTRHHHTDARTHSITCTHRCLGEKRPRLLVPRQPQVAEERGDGALPWGGRLELALALLEVGGDGGLVPEEKGGEGLVGLVGVGCWGGGGRGEREGEGKEGVC